MKSYTVNSDPLWSRTIIHTHDRPNRRKNQTHCRKAFRNRNRSNPKKKKDNSSRQINFHRHARLAYQSPGKTARARKQPHSLGLYTYQTISGPRLRSSLLSSSGKSGERELFPARFRSHEYAGLGGLRGASVILRGPALIFMRARVLRSGARHFSLRGRFVFRARPWRGMLSMSSMRGRLFFGFAEFLNSDAGPLRHGGGWWGTVVRGGDGNSGWPMKRRLARVCEEFRIITYMRGTGRLTMLGSIHYPLE